MKRRLRILVVLVSTVAMVLVLNVGVAFAHPDNAPFTDDVNDAVVVAPAGRNLVDEAEPGHPGFLNGNFGRPGGIANNPNCPAHYL